jgi:hypothetical protein
MRFIAQRKYGRETRIRRIIETWSRNPHETMPFRSELCEGSRGHRSAGIARAEFRAAADADLGTARFALAPRSGAARRDDCRSRWARPRVAPGCPNEQLEIKTSRGTRESCWALGRVRART